MTKEEQLQLLYRIYEFPPKTQKEADRSFAWALLMTGCPVQHILAATEYLFVHDHPDDAYEPDEAYERQDDYYDPADED